MEPAHSPNHNLTPEQSSYDPKPSPKPTQNSQQLYQKQSSSDSGLIPNILSIVFIFFFPPLGIVAGAMGRSRSKKDGYNGELGLIGLVINTVITAIGIIFILFLLIVSVFLLNSKGTVPNISFNSALPYSVNETEKATVARADRYSAHFDQELRPPTWLESKGVFGDKTSETWCRFATGTSRDLCNPTQEDKSLELLLETITLSDREDPTADIPYFFYKNVGTTYTYSYYSSPDRTTFELTNEDAPKNFTLPQRPGATLITGEFGIQIKHPTSTVTNNQYFGPLLEQSAHDDLMKYLESADSLKSHTLRKIIMTRDAALQELWKTDSGFKQEHNCRSTFGEGSVCDYKEFSATDKQLIQDYIQDNTDLLITFLNDNYQEMYQQLVTASRYEICPKCLIGE